MTEKCWIWATEAEIGGGVGDFTTFNSPRAGGKYRVARSVSSTDVKQHDPTKLTEWLIAQRRQGDDAPLITSHTAEVIRSISSLGVLEKRDRVLEFLTRRSSKYGAPIRVTGTLDTELNTTFIGLQLAAQCRDSSEAHAFLIFLEEGGLIAFDTPRTNVRVTFPGWQYVEKRGAQESELVQAFVAMWFHKSTEVAFIEGIAPAIRECGYRPLRIDQKEHVNKVDDEIVAEIRRSKFLVADFTSEPEKPRGGVYFEAGFAMGLGKKVIWTCHESCLKFVHFDTRQFNHIVWNDTAELKAKLKNRIGAVLGQGPAPLT
jgi:nucleoside 2-deoxyribosyltransferase